MEDTHGESQVCSRCNKEVACSNFAPELHGQLLSLCPDCEEAVQQERQKQHDTDRHSQSEENESSPQCCESIQHELPSENPPDHTVNSGCQEESCADCKSPTLRRRGLTTPCHWRAPQITVTVRPIARGKRFSYQQDPRPHFGVPRSSRSTAVPLWGYEGPLRGKRMAEETDQMSTCPHCHLALSPDTLRWHETKCLIFEGIKNSLAK